MPSLYCAIRAFLSFAQIFNTYTAPIIDSALRFYPRDTQRCIRTSITLSKLPDHFIDYEVFHMFYIRGDASDQPVLSLSSLKGHRILEKAWQIHWLNESTLDDLLSRVEHLYHSKIAPGSTWPPYPASWTEEQCFLRAWWRGEVYEEMSHAVTIFTWPHQARAAAGSWLANRATPCGPIAFWDTLPRHELEEMIALVRIIQGRFYAQGVSPGNRVLEDRRCFFYREDLV